MKNLHRIKGEIYITAPQEEIRVNDYITDGYLVWQWKDDNSLLGRYKVIMTSDKQLDGVREIPSSVLSFLAENLSYESLELYKGCCEQCNERLCEVYDLGIKELEYK